MKITAYLFFLFIPYLSSPQNTGKTLKNGKPNSKTIILRDQNNAQGKQVINYYTINNFNNRKAASKERSVLDTRGYFKLIKDMTAPQPYIRLGGMISHNNKQSFSLQNDPLAPVDARRVAGLMKIEAIIRDSKGDEFARITGDTWEISNTQNIEYNNDASGFEIRTGKRVIFQMNIVKDTVSVNGMICSEYGACMFCNQGTTFMGPKYQETQRFILPSNFIVQPLFKYPRFQYLGVREPIK